MKVFGMEIREDTSVPPGEVWFTQPIGFVSERVWDGKALRFIVTERHRVVGKIVGLPE